jgi:hypothetical protein
MSATVTLMDAGRVQYTTELVVEVCCCCGVPFAIPRPLYNELRADSDRWFWCVNGHRQHYTESEADRLKRKLSAAQRRADSAESAARLQRGRAERAERSASAYKGVATRVRNRAASGVCPVNGCKRHFANLASHMASRHPGWADEPLVPGE